MQALGFSSLAPARPPAAEQRRWASARPRLSSVRSRKELQKLVACPARC